MNKFLKVVHYLNWIWVMLASIATYLTVSTAERIGMPEMMMSLLLIIMNYCFARGFDEVFAVRLKAAPAEKKPF